MPTSSPLVPVHTPAHESIGWWVPEGSPPDLDENAIERAVHQVGRAVHVIRLDDRIGIGRDGLANIGSNGSLPAHVYRLVAYAPVLRPEQLGDPAFRAEHGLKYAYVAGAMANGISSARMVEAVGQAGMLGFFGSAGLELDRVEKAIDQLQRNLGDRPYGFNLIHSPAEPELESALVDLYLRRNVSLVSASAYLDLTLPLVRYRVTGIHRAASGQIIAPNKVVAKVSRVELARKFFSPPPVKMLQALVEQGVITLEQARLAEAIPMAQDLTAESDSGGHTDNRPALALLPTMLALRDEMQERYGYESGLRVGAAGSIATPSSTAAAFATGAAYVLTGSINQACVEAGTSPVVREMLTRAKQADVTMAPAADMFEMGVKVQVLKWGTMFAVRARKLYDLYRTYDRLDEIPVEQRRILERDYFRCTLDEVWARTRQYFAQRDPGRITQAQRDRKHQMALVFRSYLGQASNWANTGEPTRKADYQIWCGPAMGAFNEWARGSFLEGPGQRDVVTVAMNLLVGAAALTRVSWLRTQGIPLSAGAQRFAPRTLSRLSALLR